MPSWRLTQKCNLLLFCRASDFFAGMHAHDCSSGSVMPVMVLVLVVLVLSKDADCSAAQSCERWPRQIVMLALHALCVLLVGGCIAAAVAAAAAAIACTKLHACTSAIRNTVHWLLTCMVSLPESKLPHGISVPRQLCRTER